MNLLRRLFSPPTAKPVGSRNPSDVVVARSYQPSSEMPPSLEMGSRALADAWGSPKQRARLLDRLTTADAREWLNLDAAVRRAYQTSAAYARPPDASGSVIQIGMRSMHPDGYVREQAIAELSSTPEPLSGAFLALRAFDWVDEVAIRARNILNGRVRADTDTLAIAVPILLRASGRFRADGAIDRVLEAATESDMRRLVPVLLASPDPLTRRYALRKAMQAETPLLDREALTELALRDRDTPVAEQAGRHAVELANRSGSRESLERLLAGRPVVRRAVLAALPSDRESLDVAARLAFDRSPIVRTQAQAMLRAAGIEPTTLYREAVGRLDRRAVAVREIGELGGARVLVTVQMERKAPFITNRREIDQLREITASDANLMRGHLGDPAPSVRSSAIRALFQLEGWAVVLDAARLLDDPSPGVVKTVVRILRHAAPSLPIDDLRALCSAAQPIHVRTGALRLRHWRGLADRLEADLEAVHDVDPRVADLGGRDIAALLARPARLERPEVDSRRRLSTMLDAAEMHLDPDAVKLLRFHLGLRPVDLNP